MSARRAPVDYLLLGLVCLYGGIGTLVGLLFGRPLLGLLCGGPIGALTALPILMVNGAADLDSAARAHENGRVPDPYPSGRPSAAAARPARPGHRTSAGPVSQPIRRGNRPPPGRHPQLDPPLLLGASRSEDCGTSRALRTSATMIDPVADAAKAGPRLTAAGTELHRAAVVRALWSGVDALRTSAAICRWRATLRPHEAQSHLAEADRQEQDADTLVDLSLGDHHHH